MDEVFKDLNLLSSNSRLARWEALERLIMHAPEKIARLAALSCLDDPYDAIRVTAVDALAWCARRRDVSALLRMSHDHYPFVRASAADALSRFDTQQVRRRLIDMLSDPHRLVRSWSAQAVAVAMRTSGAEGLLLKRFEIEGDDYVRLGLCAAMIECGEQQYRPQVEAYVNHEDGLVHAFAVSLLKRLANNDVSGEQKCSFEFSASRSVGPTRTGIGANES